MKYVAQNASNIVRLTRCLQQHKNIFQFIYSRCYPKIYSLIDKRGIEIKSEFLLTFKFWKDKKKFQQHLLQQLEEEKKQSTSDEEKAAENEQQLEKKPKEKREKRRILAAENERLKSSKKKKTVDEKTLWGQLNEPNQNFANIKNFQKENKNKFTSLIRN